MRQPDWKYEFNLNSILLIIAFGTTIFGWGYVWSDMQAKQQRNSDSIINMKTDITALKTGLTNTNTDVAELKFRTTALETTTAAATNALHEQEKAIAQIASDVRVTREIVERLDNRHRPERSP